jgi:hypothetical protein
MSSLSIAPAFRRSLFALAWRRSSAFRRKGIALLHYVPVASDAPASAVAVRRIKAAMGAVEAMEAKMRVLNTGDLKRMSRAELWNLLRKFSKVIAKAPRPSIERRNARRSLGRIRAMLIYDDLPPY